MINYVEIHTDDPVTLSVYEYDNDEKMLDKITIPDKILGAGTDCVKVSNGTASWKQINNTGQKCCANIKQKLFRINLTCWV